MASDGDRDHLRAYVEYFRDMGVYDFYRRGEPVFAAVAAETVVEGPVAESVVAKREPVVAPVRELRPVSEPARSSLEVPIPKLVSFNDLAALPETRVARARRGEALKEIQEEIGDCTRCPLAYAGRHKI